MKFKDFITRQRLTIFIAGVVVFVITLIIAHHSGASSETGTLFINLAASSVTIISTALILDFLNAKERHSKTEPAAKLAKDEVRNICYRMEISIARLYGLKRTAGARENISNHEEARQYLQKLTDEVGDYLSRKDIFDANTSLSTEALRNYLERLQQSLIDLEQTLILYEYALSYKLRESILILRSELQIVERLLGFMDTSVPLNKANLSLISITSQSVYEATESVLANDSAS